MCKLRGADARATCQRARGDPTFALGGRQSEAAARRRGGEGRACASGVPRAGGDDAAVLLAAANDVEIARSAESAASWRRARRGGSGCRRGASRLWKIFDATAGAGGIGQAISRHKLASLNGAADVVKVPNFIQSARTASKVDLIAVVLLQSRLNFGRGVCLAAGRRNAGSAQPLVGRQRLEERNSSVEEVWHFLSRLVVGVAVRV